MKITVSVRVNKPLLEVWKAYISPEDIVNWNFASDDWHTPSSRVDFRVGGMFSSRMEAKDGSAGFDFEGIYTNIIEHELIEYEFGGRIASIRFTEDVNTSVVEVSFDTEDENPVELQRQGWQAILDNFGRYVESM